MDKRKVRNAKKVDEAGNPIGNLNEFKTNHKDAIIFDSKLEWKTYSLLKEAGIKVILKPNPILLIPEFKTLKFDYLPEQKTELRKNSLKVKTKKEKNVIKREFNKTHYKSILSEKIRKSTWAVDFFLPDYNLYVEAKGFPNEAFPLKLKFARYILSISKYSIIVVRNQKDVNDLIKYLKNK